VKKLAVKLTDFQPVKVDICPQSCIAYTGEHEDITSCPHIQEGKKYVVNHITKRNKGLLLRINPGHR